MKKHKRRSIRLPEYDYSQPGSYFVTICVRGRACRLGMVKNGEMILNPIGEIAKDAWIWLGQTFAACNVDVFCIMPNHTHAILSIVDPDRVDHDGKGDFGRGDFGKGDLQIAPTEQNHTTPASHIAPTEQNHTTPASHIAPTEQNHTTPASDIAPTDIKLKPLGRLVGAFKTHSTVQINRALNTPGKKFWQRNYYERIIRDEKEYAAIGDYILHNPFLWDQDENYPTEIDS